MKINKNSKRQLKLKIKSLKEDNSTLWDMVHKRDDVLRRNKIMIGMSENEFLTGNEECI